MKLGSIYNKLSEVSPFIEVLLRKLYWNNVEILKKYSSNRNERIYRTEYVDFEEIIDFLKECGIGKGDIVILHSSYGTLKPISLNHKEIILRLLEYLGDEGTLAAPVIRVYKEEEHLSLKEKLAGACESLTCLYDVENTPIWSGLLSKTIMEFPDSVTSRHPLNPLTAIGKHAKNMMSCNIDGEFPSAHGQNSSWKYCADNDAYILYLGVDFGHHITMQQVVSEAYPDYTPINYYYKRKFIIKDGDFEKEIIVKERKRSMTVFLPERCVRKDIINAGIVKMKNIKGIPISVIRAKELISFFRTQRKYYPYYIR